MGVAVVFGAAAIAKCIVTGRATLHMHDVYLATDPVGFWTLIGPLMLLWAAGAFQVITGWGIKDDTDRNAGDDVSTKMPTPEKPG